MRSDTAFFSATVIGRRFLSGLRSDLLFVAADAGFLGEEDGREVERDAGGADAPSISSTSVNALISAWRRSISLCRSAMACAMTLMKLESSGPVREMSSSAEAALRPVASTSLGRRRPEPPLAGTAALARLPRVGRGGGAAAGGTSARKGSPRVRRAGHGLSATGAHLATPHLVEIYIVVTVLGGETDCVRDGVGPGLA